MTMTLRGCCAAEVKVTQDEREVLFDPAETGSQRARLLCELEARHAGPHWALGDNGGETEECAGLAWTDDGGRELVVQVEFCPAHGPYPKYDDPDWICTLRLGHPGAHCFEMDGVDYGDDLS
jgi:hypothetical protein